MSAFQTFSSAFRGGNRGRPARGWITPLDIHNNDKPIDLQTRAFQYFPESISDNKSNGYQAKQIPGLSHPLYQWTAGGPREINFTAVFSADIPPEDPTKAKRSPEDKQRNVDVDAAIAWLQSYQYPEYSENGYGKKNGNVRPKPPRKMILTLPNVRINYGRLDLCPDEIACIMLSAEVSRESFFPNGATRLAKVELSFAEIIQIGGTVRPHDAFPIRNEGITRYQLSTDESQPSEGRTFDSYSQTEFDRKNTGKV